MSTDTKTAILDASEALFAERGIEASSLRAITAQAGTNLAAVILQAKALQLGEIEEIPFLDPPRPETVRDGYKTLFEIGAVDS